MYDFLSAAHPLIRAHCPTPEQISASWRRRPGGSWHAKLPCVADLERALVRTRRAALARSVRRDAAAAVAARAATIPELASARRVAAYVPHNGELDPSPIVRAVWRRGAAAVLPVVREDGPPSPLEFAAYTPVAPLVRGRHGIRTPSADASRCPVDEIDVVLLPLLAFDAWMTRVGSGGGYYDRTFAARRDAPAPPLLIGLAYHWQQVARLDRAPWDVPLDIVVTERAIMVAPGRRAVGQPR